MMFGLPKFGRERKPEGWRSRASYPPIVEPKVQDGEHDFAKYDRDHINQLYARRPEVEQAIEELRKSKNPRNLNRITVLEHELRTIKIQLDRAEADFGLTKKPDLKLVKDEVPPTPAQINISRPRVATQEDTDTMEVLGKIDEAMKGDQVSIRKATPKTVERVNARVRAIADLDNMLSKYPDVKQGMTLEDRERWIKDFIEEELGVKN